MELYAPEGMWLNDPKVLCVNGRRHPFLSRGVAYGWRYAADQRAVGR